MKGARVSPWRTPAMTPANDIYPMTKNPKTGEMYFYLIFITNALNRIPYMYQKISPLTDWRIIQQEGINKLFNLI